MHCCLGYTITDFGNTSPSAHLWFGFPMIQMLGSHENNQIKLFNSWFIFFFKITWWLKTLYSYYSTYLVYIKSASIWGQDIRKKKNFEVWMLILFRVFFVLEVLQQIKMKFLEFNSWRRVVNRTQFSLIHLSTGK